MKLLLLALAGFAAYEAYSVATTGTDIFYGAYPLPADQRERPALEWAAGALALGAAGAGMR